MRQGGIEPPAQLIRMAKLYFTTKPLALVGKGKKWNAYITYFIRCVTTTIHCRWNHSTVRPSMRAIDDKSPLPMLGMS